jgi:tripartite-type tricarboxylate transporter receptor subunit TctC
MDRRQTLTGLGALLTAPWGHTADALPAWPQRPVRLVVPYSAGGNADATARALATPLAEQWGQPLLIDNRPGGGGSIGASVVAKAPSDGYTWLLDATSFAVNPLLMPKLPYGGLADFAPVSLLTRAPLLLVVPMQSPFQSVADLLKVARTQRGKLSYASAGNGGAQHLAAELFKQTTQSSITHIPYRGGAPALTDLVAGQVDLMFSATSASGPLVKAGKLRALGVTSLQRVDGFPQVPTLAEQGVRDVEVSEWTGLFAPVGTAVQIVSLVETQVRTLMTTAALTQRWREMGVLGVGSTAAEFARFLDQETHRWGRVIKTAGIRID